MDCPHLDFSFGSAGVGAAVGTGATIGHPTAEYTDVGVGNTLLGADREWQIRAETWKSNMDGIFCPAQHEMRAEVALDNTAWCIRCKKIYPAIAGTWHCECPMNLCESCVKQVGSGVDKGNYVTNENVYEFLAMEFVIV